MTVVAAALAMMMILPLTTEAFLLPSSSSSVSSMTSPRKVRGLQLLKNSDKGDDIDEDLTPILTEEQQLQAELDQLVGKDTPMFGAFNGDAIDKDALPVPLFTSIIILIGSIVWTYLLFDAGINGI